MPRLLALFILLVILLVPVSSSAQDRGQIGMTLGYPAAVGIIWHVSDRVAVRPEFSFSRSTTEDETDLSDGSSWGVGVGIGALFYLTRTDNLRTYISPRYSYARSTTTSTSTSPFFPEEAREFTGTTSSVTGSFGAQYALSTRFSAFGEVGVGYARHSLRSSSFSAIRPTSQSWSTRSGAGFILYF